MEREHSKLKALSGRDLHHLVRIYAFEASLQIWLAGSVGQEPLKLSLFLLFCGPLLRPAFGPCHGFPFSIWDPLSRDRAQPEGSSCRGWQRGRRKAGWRTPTTEDEPEG